MGLVDPSGLGIGNLKQGRLCSTRDLYGGVGQSHRNPFNDSMK